MDRKIVIYGHSDSEEKFGFDTVEKFRRLIEVDIFEDREKDVGPASRLGRYFYTKNNHADIIVLSYQGFVHGYFETANPVPDNPSPDEQKWLPKDKNLYAYDIVGSYLYKNPVRLYDFGIKNIQFGKVITESQFQEITKAVGKIISFSQLPSIPSSVVQQEWILCELLKRNGQSPFKDALLKVYNGKCPITDCTVADALIAAHIAPYAESFCNDVSNGLQLRADIHMLFDKHLVAINPETGQVEVTPSERRDGYDKLHGKPFPFPKNESHRPKLESLKVRWNKFKKNMT